MNILWRVPISIWRFSDLELIYSKSTSACILGTRLCGSARGVLRMLFGMFAGSGGTHVRKAFVLKQSHCHLPERVAGILVHGPLAGWSAESHRRACTTFSRLRRSILGPSFWHSRASDVRACAGSRTGWRFMGIAPATSTRVSIASSAVLRSDALPFGRAVVSPYRKRLGTRTIDWAFEEGRGDDVSTPTIYNHSSG